MKYTAATVIRVSMMALLPSCSIAANSPRSAWDEAERDGSPARYEKIIRQFPNELDERAGSYWPEKRSVKYSDNARIHLLNRYVDWEQKKVPKEIAKARTLARELLKRPNGMFVVDFYTGYTRPHTLLILAALSDNQREQSEYYLQVVRDHWGDIGGRLFGDSGFQYGPVANRHLEEMVNALPESDPLRHSLEKSLKQLARRRPSN